MNYEANDSSVIIVTNTKLISNNLRFSFRNK